MTGPRTRDSLGEMVLPVITDAGEIVRPSWEGVFATYQLNCHFLMTIQLLNYPFDMAGQQRLFRKSILNDRI
jgi:hypothetical protein